MNRVLLVFLAVFAFAARSDGTLRCYMCNSQSNAACEDPSKDGNLQPVECEPRAMTSWHTEMQRNVALQNIAHLFEVDQPQHFTHLPNVACAKMNLKVGSEKVTLRSCQTAKTDTVDPCRAFKNKLDTDSARNAAVSMDYCGLCDNDACNGAFGLAPPNVLQLLIGSISVLFFQAYRLCFA
ncbi:uncharacterized protein LOC105692657 [Athalia rosae]|uniref:uncharacterized protein LOC105692657 n=1 Tax=Athalia rosae TaxID=37344 RepID=UPI0006260DB7|nr:uncharacterized protein LOC105692657 [Athalia rosae]